MAEHRPRVEIGTRRSGRARRARRGQHDRARNGRPRGTQDSWIPAPTTHRSPRSPRPSCSFRTIAPSSAHGKPASPDPGRCRPDMAQRNRGGAAWACGPRDRALGMPGESDQRNPSALFQARAWQTCRAAGNWLTAIAERYNFRRDSAPRSTDMVGNLAAKVAARCRAELAYLGAASLQTCRDRPLMRECVPVSCRGPGCRQTGLQRFSAGRRRAGRGSLRDHGPAE